jgi:hypothetical protein
VKDTVFFKQAELLLRILPLIYKEDVFALKGGTAINFFVTDLPRLSVDIDLAYLPVNDRDFAMNEIRRPFAVPGFSKACFWRPESPFKAVFEEIIKRLIHYIEVFLRPDPICPRFFRRPISLRNE